MPRRQATPESYVLKAVLELFAVERVLAFRMNTGMVMVGLAGGKQRPLRFGVPGQADVLAFFGGTYPCWVECKAAGGKQRPAQKAFQELVEGHGHGYILAFGTEDVTKWAEANKARWQ